MSPTIASGNETEDASEDWQERHTHLALPPYWFFDSASCHRILEERIKAGHAIGVHVPTEIPDDPAARPEQFQGYDLFTQPGESRDITGTD